MYKYFQLLTRHLLSILVRGLMRRCSHKSVFSSDPFTFKSSYVNFDVFRGYFRAPSPPPWNIPVFLEPRCVLRKQCSLSSSSLVSSHIVLSSRTQLSLLTLMLSCLYQAWVGDLLDWLSFFSFLEDDVGRDDHFLNGALQVFNIILLTVWFVLKIYRYGNFWLGKNKELVLQHLRRALNTKNDTVVITKSSLQIKDVFFYHLFNY